MADVTPIAEHHTQYKLTLVQLSHEKMKLVVYICA